MKITSATEKALAGAAIARTGWNGKEQFVFARPKTKATAAEIKKYGLKAGAELNAHFLIKTPNGSLSIWVPSLSDTMANDWVVVDIPKPVAKK